MSLVHNEQTKLTATLLNSVAIAAIAVGLVAPFATAIVGTMSFGLALVSSAIWLPIAAFLHYSARWILKRLIE